MQRAGRPARPGLYGTWRRGWWLAVATVLLLSLALPAAAARARNVILLIGDGMGPAQVALAEMYGREVHGRGLRMLEAADRGRLGLSLTSSADSLVTDSAAAATAIATGHKTNNGAISQDPQGKRLPTILELARDKGLSTGLVVTCTITHATPACFAAHVPNRASEADIAVQMATAGVDVLLGGGLGFFRPKALGGARSDGRDLLENMRQSGYAVVRTRQELSDCPARRVLGLFADGYLAPAFVRQSQDPGQPRLAEMTGRAIDTLSRARKGFFLMVEGSQIDSRCHGNDAAGALHEVLEFDEAVGVALDFARRHRDTLVIITGDHETGGLVVTGGRDQIRALAKVPLPLDGAGIADGMAPAPIAAAITERLGLDVAEKDIAGLLAPANVFDRKTHGLPLLRLLGTRCGVSWTTTSHTATPVYLIGYGPGSEGILGVQENTATFTLMRRALGL